MIEVARNPPNCRDAYLAALNACFAGWGGACLGMDACSFVMDGPKEVKAIFNTL